MKESIVITKSALVSRSMRKKFHRTFPEWRRDPWNEEWRVGKIFSNKPDYFYVLYTEEFTDEQEQFFIEHNISRTDKRTPIVIPD